jgi:hypothetical protein
LWGWGFGDWGLGIGDWDLEIGDLELGKIPNPHILHFYYNNNFFKYL